MRIPPEAVGFIAGIDPEHAVRLSAVDLIVPGAVPVAFFSGKPQVPPPRLMPRIEDINAAVVQLCHLFPHRIIQIVEIAEHVKIFRFLCTV